MHERMTIDALRLDFLAKNHKIEEDELDTAVEHY